MTETRQLKKPGIAGLLNFLLPGLGLWYLRKWMWGVLNLLAVFAVAFVVALVLPMETYDSISTGLAVGLGIASAIFATETAKRMNRQIPTAPAEVTVEGGTDTALRTPTQTDTRDHHMQPPPMPPSATVPFTLPEKLKHSGIGVASFVLSLVMVFVIIAAIVFAGIMAVTSPESLHDEAPATMLLGLGIIAAGLAQLVALALGIVGCRQRNRKRLFAILGVLCSGAAILGTLGLMVIGIMAD
ncbi:MAG: hypothetical protein ACYS8X_10110 [Planctomycetota bacterium]|jgi:hypothetical protein